MLTLFPLSCSQDSAPVWSSQHLPNTPPATALLQDKAATPLTVAPCLSRDTVLVAKRLLHAGDSDRAAGGCCSQGSGLVYPSPVLSAPVPIPSDRPRKRPAGLTASWRFLSLPLEIF